MLCPKCNNPFQPNNIKNTILEAELSINISCPKCDSKFNSVIAIHEFEENWEESW